MSYCLALVPIVHGNMQCRAVDITGNLAGVFVFLAGDRSGISVQAAFLF
jgi:hypothetical protein